MEKNISLSSPLKRITILDALRGFALLGVILMHMIQHFGIRTNLSQNGKRLQIACRKKCQSILFIQSNKVIDSGNLT